MVYGRKDVRLRKTIDLASNPSTDNLRWDEECQNTIFVGMRRRDRYIVPVRKLHVSGRTSKSWLQSAWLQLEKKGSRHYFVPTSPEDAVLVNVIDRKTGELTKCGLTEQSKLSPMAPMKIIIDSSFSPGAAVPLVRDTIR